MASKSYTVTGMTCDHCAGSVTTHVTKIPGVSRVEVDVATGRLTVSSADDVSDDAVARAVDDAGYAVS